MRLSRVLLCAGLAGLLGSCGGGSGSPTPTPAPSPTPSPTPSPPPIPTPTPTSPGRAFTAESGPCFVYLFSQQSRSTSDPKYSGQYCEPGGMFVATAPYRPEAFGTLTVADVAQNYVVVEGVELAGYTRYRYTGPLGTKMFSPLSTLTEAAGSQAAVKRALGLDSGPFALSTDRDLLTFDAYRPLQVTSFDQETRQDSARITAANLRIAAILASLQTVTAGQYDTYAQTLPDYGLLGVVTARNGALLSSEATISGMLTEAAGFGRYRADVLDAAAHLIVTFNSAASTDTSSLNAAATYTTSIQGFLQLELASLLQANSAGAAATVAAVTEQDIRNRTALFRSTTLGGLVQNIPVNGKAYLYPSPDYFATTGSSVNIDVGVGAHSILNNDLYADGAPGSIGFQRAAIQPKSFIVPPSNAMQITTSGAGGTLTVQALSGFKGTSYVVYRVTHTSGEEAGGVIFVTFK